MKVLSDIIKHMQQKTVVNFKGLDVFIATDYSYRLEGLNFLISKISWSPDTIDSGC